MMLVNTIRVLLIASVLPSVVSQVNVPCQVDADCGGDSVCFQGSFCACNLDTDGGCAEGQVCVEVLGDAGLQPMCVVPGSVPVGDICIADIECETDFCTFNPVFNTCSCNPETNVGCAEDEVCQPSIAVDDPNICVRPADLQPIGSECVADSECESGVCFFSETSSAFCVCNVETNAGCGQDEVCQYLPDVIGFDVAPFCFSDDLPIGSDCRADFECESGVCYYVGTPPEFLPPGTTGVCECNVENNDGCGENEFCDFPSGLVGAPPMCIPLGASECIPWTFQLNGGGRFSTT